VKRLIVLAALMAAAPAAARDARLETRLYDGDAVVRLEGRAGVQATIAFAPDEHIENVAVGDSALWQVTPNKRANLLFVKPLAPRARTNMTVVTDRRSYFLDLVAAPDARAVYLLRYTYPPEPKKAEAAATGLSAEEAQLAGGAAPVDPARLNFGWAAKGKPSLLPARIYDDGTSTYLAWAAGRAVPAVLVRDEKGAEGPVNYAVREDMIVLDGVPGTIVLRSGKEAATLVRQAPARTEPAATATPSLADNRPTGAK